MALGGPDIRPLDGSLGSSVDSAESVHVVMGVASSGDTNTPVLLGSADDVPTIFGEGPLVDAAVTQLLQLGSVIAMRVAAAASGTLGTPTVVAGAGTGTIAFGGTPLNSYPVRIRFTKAGEAGVALYQYSLDGGRTWSTPATFTTAVAEDLGESGVTVTFTDAGTAPEASFALDMTAEVEAVAPAPTAGELGTAVDALLATDYKPACIHVAGPTAAAAWTALQAKAEAAALSNEAHRWLYFVCETSTPAEGASAYSTWVTARLAEASGLSVNRVAVVAGFGRYTDPRTGRLPPRNAAAVMVARDMRNPVQRSSGAVADGPLPGMAELYPPSAMSGAASLDAAGFTVVRTHAAIGGVYVAKGRMLAPASDYYRLNHRRVMDKACRLVDQAAVLRVEEELDTDTASLAAFAATLNRPIRWMVAAGECQSGRVLIDPNQDILGTDTIEASIELVPRAYAGTIRVNIRFINPFGTAE